MGLTQVSTDGVKNDAISHNKIPANAIQASELADNAVDTAAIADQAVTLDKLPHGTSSNNGKFLRANNGADPSFETVSIPAGTTINNNAANRVILGSDTANTLNTDSELTYASNYFNVGDAALKSNQLKFAPAGTVYIDHYTTGQDIQFRTSVSSQIDTTGPTIKSTGNIAFASGKGIDFSSTANGGTGTPSELFDDYEEGSWTPAIEGLSNTPSFFNLGGNYTKIGNRVFVQCHIQVNGSNKPLFTNVAAAFKISGLPFTGNNSGAGGGYFGAHGVCVWQQLQWVGGSYSSYGHGDDTQLSPGIVDSGTRITLQTCGQGIYYTGQLLNRALHNNYAPNIEFDMWYRTT